MTEPVIEAVPDSSGLWLFHGDTLSALYLNGSLVKCGEHQIVLDELFGILGVGVRYTNTFLSIDGAKVAETAKEIEDNAKEIEEAAKTAAILRTEAAELIAKAEALEAIEAAKVVK